MRIAVVRLPDIHPISTAVTLTSTLIPLPSDWERRGKIVFNARQTLIRPAATFSHPMGEGMFWGR